MSEKPKVEPVEIDEKTKDVLANYWRYAPGNFASYLSMMKCIACTTRHPKATHTCWRFAPHLEMLSIKLALAAGGRIPRLIVEMPPRHGKALEVNTPIPTPDGWKRIGDLKVGDVVFDETGLRCNVIAVSPVWKDRDVYSVTTDDGDTIIADGDHEWVVRLCRKRPVFKIKTTAELAERTSRRAPMIQAQRPLQLPDADLPVPPYVLGLWLGDGHSRCGIITKGEEDIPYLRSRVEALGFKTTTLANPQTFGILKLKVLLREIGVLENKHIPQQYLRASRRQRIDLLQGLIDSDGYVSPGGQVEFSSCRKELAEQTLELVRSLGVKAMMLEGTATLYGRVIGPKYRVMFYMAEAASLPRKAQNCRSGIRGTRRYITVSPAGKSDTVCIQVDSLSSMFLCGKSMLPTHNSELVSRWFPAWFLTNNLHGRVILCSYEADFAASWGRKVRDILTEYKRILPCRLNGRSSASDHWDLESGGGMVTAGVGGPITGRGANVLIVDDPVKNAEEANSQVVRDKTWDWWQSTAVTRLEPGGAAVVVMTRWHEDDLVGRLVRAQEEGGEQWERIRLPARAEENDPLNRNVGDVLWPDRWPAEEMDRVRRSVGSMVWSALYQQRPTRPEGNFFKRAWFELVDRERLPHFKKAIRYWDKAATVEGEGGNSDPDFTAGARLGVTEHGVYYLLDMVHFRDSPQNVERRIMRTAAYDGYDVAIRMEQEPGSAGKDVISHYARNVLDGYDFKGVRSTGEKTVRVNAFAAACERGDVKIVRAPWNDELFQELCEFPNGRHDDQVDAIDGAYRALSRGGGVWDADVIRQAFGGDGSRKKSKLPDRMARLLRR